MKEPQSSADETQMERAAASDSAPYPDAVCPVCGGPLISEKCKVVCRSERCRYRIVFNCAEF